MLELSTLAYQRTGSGTNSTGVERRRAEIDSQLRDIGDKERWLRAFADRVPGHPSVQPLPLAQPPERALRPGTDLLKTGDGPMHATAATAGLTAKKTTARMGQYMYAVIDCPAEQSLATVGIDGGTVRMITSGRVAAVVSEVPNRKIRPERRRLAAHHGVLEELRQQFTVLPIAFGVIADNLAAVREILIENREVFVEQIKRVAGNVEMGPRMSWDVPNIFDYFVETHDELRTARPTVSRRTTSDAGRVNRPGAQLRPVAQCRSLEAC